MLLLPQKGHYKSHCKVLFENLKELKKSKESNSTSVAEGVVSLDYGDVCSVTLGMEKLNWILDSGCSFHMCSSRRYFFTYQRVDENSIKMINNTVNKIVGIDRKSTRLNSSHRL